jgi:hypothetical protein
MSLKRPTPSEPARRALVEGLGDYMDSSHPVGRALLQTPVALHVFTLTLDDVPRGVHKARSAGWRFLAVAPSGVPVAGDVIEPEGLQPRMTGLSLDPIIGRAILATRRVASLPEVEAKDYELQVLRIPGVLTEAFWLKSINGGEDLMVPVLTASKLLKKMRPYPIGDFFRIVQDLIPEFSDKKPARVETLLDSKNPPDRSNKKKTKTKLSPKKETK